MSTAPRWKGGGGGGGGGSMWSVSSFRMPCTTVTGIGAKILCTARYYGSGHNSNQTYLLALHPLLKDGATAMGGDRK